MKYYCLFDFSHFVDEVLVTFHLAALDLGG